MNGRRYSIWLPEIMEVHRFPTWLCGVMRCLVASWNTRIVTTTKREPEASRCIRFNNGLPLGDSLYPRLFTLSLNPVVWSLEATEGYRLSKPINASVSQLLYIDDLKAFASSEAKLNRILKSTSAAMEDIGILRSAIIAIIAVSSIGQSVGLSCAGGRGFEPRPDQSSWS